MKTLHSSAIGSLLFVAAGLILAAPSLSSAGDRFSLTYTSDSHEGHAVLAALGHVVGVQVTHKDPHRHVQRAPRVIHAPVWHYAPHGRHTRHIFDARCTHLGRFVHHARIAYPPRHAFSVRPTHLELQPKRAHKKHSRYPRHHARQIRVHHGHD